MARIKKSALVTYTNQQMFALIDDIDSYQLFLPWCRGSSVLRREHDWVEARLDVVYGAMRKSFTTRNINVPHRLITMELLEGPFSTLQGRWEFSPLSAAGSKILLDLEFEFSNSLLTATIGPVFSQIANSLVDAFIQRAKQIYG